MKTEEKLAILADAAKYDASCASSGSKRTGKKGQLGSSTNVGICHSYTPDGRCVSLLKILFTNNCIYNCNYCINRITSDVKRATFTVDEVVKLTINFYKRNYIEGLFLSSGIIKSPDYTMEKLVLVAKRLRTEENYNGYIHLKAVAGASAEILAEASLWSDRLSANIELPEDSDLNILAPGKSHKQIHGTMNSLKTFKDEGLEDLKSKSVKMAKKRVPAGQSTQMIVGATKSSDLNILNQTNHMYKNYKLKRVYYTAYSPIQDQHEFLPAQSPPLVREHRLYQADWLLRFYKYNVDEIVNEKNPNLDLDIDPKLSWALNNKNFFPVDVNKASKHELLRVPGLGVRNVLKILTARRQQKIKMSDLKKLKVQLSKAKFFILTSDFNPFVHMLDSEKLTFKKEEQLSLFSENFSGLTGEV